MGYVGCLYDWLVIYFGIECVFMDVEGIEFGVDFVNVIEEVVSFCCVFIVMIGDEWIYGIDVVGCCWFDDFNDFVWFEISVVF